MMIFKTIETWRAKRWVARECQEIFGFKNLGFEAALLYRQYWALATCGNFLLAEAIRQPFDRDAYQEAQRYFKTVIVEFSKGKRENRSDISDIDAFNKDIRKAALGGYRECACVLAQEDEVLNSCLFMAEHSPVADAFADEAIKEVEKNLSRKPYYTQQAFEPKIIDIKERLDAARKEGIGDKSLVERTTAPSFAEGDQQRILKTFRDLSAREVDEKPFDQDTSMFIANAFRYADVPGATNMLIDVALQAHGGSMAEKVLVGMMEPRVLVDYVVRKMETHGNNRAAIQRIVDHIAKFDLDERGLVVGRLADKLPDGSFSHQTMTFTFDEILKERSERKQKECCLIVLKAIQSEKHAENSFRNFLKEKLDIRVPVRGMTMQSADAERLENR